MSKENPNEFKIINKNERLKYRQTINELKQQLEEKDKLIEFGREEIKKRNKRIDEIVERDKKLFDDKNKELEKLKQQLAESFTEEDVEGLIEDRNKTIKFLQKELAEKQNTINEINKEFVQAVHDWKTLCAEKDKEIEKLKTKQKPIVMHSKEDYFKRCNFLEEENIKLQFAQKQLVEKEKELAYMTKQAKKFNNEAQKYYEDAYCNSFQNQKAIVELEKVKNFVDGRTYCADYINKRIQELKGE